MEKQYQGIILINLQTDICEFCEQNDLDTLEHFFYHCSKINQLWENIGNEIHVKINEKYACLAFHCQTSQRKRITKMPTNYYQ